MQIGDGVQSSLRLVRTEIPIELSRNFVGLKHVPLFYSGYAKKLSDKHKVQSRILICTLDHVYCCHPNGDILRCFPFSFIHIILHDPDRKQLAFIIPREYDLLLSCHDSYHLIHVIDTLRGLHRNETALEIRTLTRDRNLCTMGLLSAEDEFWEEEEKKQAQHAAKEELEEMRSPRLPEVVPMQQKGLFTILAENAKARWTAYQNRPEKRKGVICGWNEQWMDSDNPQMKAGGPEEVCLGKGYWALRLQKPRGFSVQLYYRPDGTVIESDGSDCEEEIDK